MRDDLNDILSFIGAESLTDEEFNSISLEYTDDPIAVYEALISVLESRENVSLLPSRLRYFFLAQGIDLGLPENSSASRGSNIFVGSDLGED
jgi:hypothetical protein